MLNERLRMYSVGQRYSEFRTGEDGYRLEYDGENFFLYVLLQNWKIQERLAVSENERIVLHFTEFRGIGFLCVKFGDLPWGDAPFHPVVFTEHGIVYSEKSFGANEGIPLTIICVDSATGELLYIRLVGMGHQFSKSWQEWILNHSNDKLSRKQYEENVVSVYRHFSSEALALIPLFWWKLEGGKL